MVLKNKAYGKEQKVAEIVTDISMLPQPNCERPPVIANLLLPSVDLSLTVTDYLAVVL